MEQFRKRSVFKNEAERYFNKFYYYHIVLSYYILYFKWYHLSCAVFAILTTAKSEFYFSVAEYLKGMYGMKHNKIIRKNEANYNDNK